MADKAKTCFVISPIGKPGSVGRKRADQILKHVIEPVATECGYGEVTRADKISDPGMISRQIIERLLEADMVVADLTDHNPSVFYEVAVRHAFRKPLVQLTEADQVIPFDVADVRTIVAGRARSTRPRGRGACPRRASRSPGGVGPRA